MLRSILKNKGCTPLKLFLLILVVSSLTHSHCAILHFFLADHKEVVVLGNLSLTYSLVDGKVASFEVAVEPTALELFANFRSVGVKALRDGNHDCLIVRTSLATSINST